MSSPGHTLCDLLICFLRRGFPRLLRPQDMRKNYSGGNQEQKNRLTWETWIWAGVWSLPIRVADALMSSSLTYPGIAISIGFKKETGLRIRNAELQPTWSEVTEGFLGQQHSSGRRLLPGHTSSMRKLHFFGSKYEFGITGWPGAKRGLSKPFWHPWELQAEKMTSHLRAAQMWSETLPWKCVPGSSKHRVCGPFLG